MNRIELMELVRERQIGRVSRREFLRQATAVLGSTAAASTLLVACSSTTTGSTPPPVVDATRPTAVPDVPSGAAPQTGLVSYPGADGTELMGYLALPEGSGPFPGVIVIQEWWGLNDHIKDVTDRFAAAGYVALAPDLYHGQSTTEPDEARKLVMELDMAAAVSEIQSAAAYLRGLDETTGRVGITGFCMGGGLVLQTAAVDDTIDAAVPFYGSPLPASQAAMVSAPVLSFLGSADNISAANYEAMHAVFDENNVPNHFQLYEGAQHAFFNDTRASYDAAAAEDAWQRMLAWFDEYLAPAS